MARHWWARRSWNDAPTGMPHDEAFAWALGYNAAVEACAAEQSAVLEREQRPISLTVRQRAARSAGRYDKVNGNLIDPHYPEVWGEDSAHYAAGFNEAERREGVVPT